MPPTLSNVVPSVTFTAVHAGVTLSPSLTVTDPDSVDLASATVSVSGGFASDGDFLTAFGHTSGTVFGISFSYDPTSETLTLSGTGSFTAYQQVLDTVVFAATNPNPNDTGSHPTRTVTWVLNDGTNLSTAQTETVNVVDAPFFITADSIDYTENGGPVMLAGNNHLTDFNSTTLVSATATLSSTDLSNGTFTGSGQATGDVLLFSTAGTSITASYDSTTETLTLSGSDSVADYAEVIASVEFNNTSVNPANDGSDPTRIVTWTLNDGGASNNIGNETETIDITTVNQPPTLSKVTTFTSSTEEHAATTLSPTLSISDPDDVTLVSATVQITGGTFSGDGDVLAANTGGTGITASYDSSSETLTLTGSDTLAHYRQVLDGVTFQTVLENPTDFGSSLFRDVVWTVNDGGGTANGGAQLSTPVTEIVRINNVNDPPVLTQLTTNASFTDDGGPIILSDPVSVSDPDDLSLSGATVQITGGTFAGDGDVLGADIDGTAITPSYNSSTETLTLSGRDTRANYQSVLETVTFNAGQNPDNYGSNPTRTLTWTLMDPSGTANGGVNISTPVTSTVAITAVSDPPTLSNVPTTAQGGFAGQKITVAPTLSLSDPDSLTLTNATVKITGGTFAGDGDVLAATTTGTGITANYNSSTETLTLTGSDTPANYGQVLASVTFNSTSANPANSGSDPSRTLTWVVNDGAASNNIGNATETIDIVNRPPTLSSVASTASSTEEHAATTLSPSLSLSDPDDVNLVSATVQITGGTFSGDGDVLAAEGQNVGTIVQGTGTITVAFSNETLTLTGADTLAHYQTVLDAVTFQTVLENPNDFGSNPTRTVVWTVNDGSGGAQVSTPVTETVSINNVNDSPTLAHLTGSASFTEEGGAVTLSGAVSVSDPDDLDLSAATVQITSGTFANDHDVLSANTAGTGITASYNSSTETLTLSGTDTLANYQSVLDTVTFNAGENPNDYGSNPTRRVAWTLMDPSGTANGGLNTTLPQTTTVSITNVNDPPTLSGVASSVPAGIGQTVTASPALSVSDPDNLTLVGATVRITGGTFAGDGDVLAATTTGTGITANYNSSTETLALTGTDTLAHYGQVLDSITFNSTSVNPTNAGSNPTRTLSWLVNDGAGSSTAAVTTITISGAVKNDFNGDGKSDVLWQNTDGTLAIWEINGSSIIGGGGLSNPGASWHVEAAADFNHDGKADIILQNDDGMPEIWLMNGASVTSTITLPNPGSSWHIIAAADFNNDGNPDILWQNNDGTPDIWLMNGTSPVGGGPLSLNPGAGWRAIGAGDFNADGKADILFQNTDGQPVIWEMNGTNVIGGGPLPLNPGASWKAIGVGDFNGDGHADILWQNADGEPDIWLMNGTNVIGGGPLPLNPGPSWHAIGTSDFNGDGKADILWQNTDGQPVIWLMNGANTIGGGPLALNPGPSWQAKADGPISPDQMGSGAPSGISQQYASTGPSPLNGTQEQSFMRSLFSGAG